MLNENQQDIDLAWTLSFILEKRRLMWMRLAWTEVFYLRKLSDPWEQNLNLNQTPKIRTSTPHYTERAPTVFREPMVRSDQVIPGNLIFRDDSRAVCTGGHHIHIRYRFAPAAAARVQLRRCVRLTCDTRARAVRCHTCLLALHALLFHFRNLWQMSCWNHPETANVMWYWPPKT